jgi:hypothetical protein
MGSGDSKPLPVAQPFQHFAKWQLAEFDVFTQNLAERNCALGITKEELKTIIIAVDLNGANVTENLFDAFADLPETLEFSSALAKDSIAINVLSVLAGLCIISNSNDNVDAVEQIKDIYDIFNLKGNGGLSLAETTIMIRSTCQALEVMFGYAQISTRRCMTMQIAESIAKEAFSKYGKSIEIITRSSPNNSDLLLSSDEFTAFIASKLLGIDILPSQVADNAWTTSQIKVERLNVLELPKKIIEEWGS